MRILWKRARSAERRVFLTGVILTLVAMPVLARQPAASTPPEYTVASGDVQAVADVRVARTRGGFDPLDALPETLALVMVGSLLLGLAAAVRRTT